MALFSKKKETKETRKRPDTDEVKIKLRLKEGPYYLYRDSNGDNFIDIMNKQGDGISFMPKVLTHDCRKIEDVFQSSFNSIIAQEEVDITLIENSTSFPLPNVVFRFKDVGSNDAQTIVYAAREGVEISVQYIKKFTVDEDEIYQGFLCLDDEIDYSGYEIIV